MQYPHKSGNLNFLVFFLVFCLIFWSIEPYSKTVTQETLIECIIIYDSSCPDCYNKYLNQVKPIYDAYKSNNLTHFELIDINNDYTFFWQEITRLNINYTSLGLDNLPWVVFRWGENQEVGFDYENLDSIESTYLAILEDQGYIPPPDNGSDFHIELFDPILLLLAGMVVLVEILVIGTSLGYYHYKRKPDLLLKRISKNRARIITSMSLISISTLTYQLLDFIVGGCGCATTSLIKSLEFRQYDYIFVLGIKIPFALIGFILMNAILIQTLLIGIFPRSMKIKLSKSHQIYLNEKTVTFLHQFLVIQSLIAFLSLFYLLYVELFILQYICLLCTISQIVIVLNTILIITWKPKRQLENQIESRMLN
ncbi:MAG: hypothetical protein ACFFAU_12540 [Candidatus Hodarchaeota archaeon]